MARFGDQDAITHGGGVILKTSSGPFLEYTEGTDQGGDILEVFRTHIEGNVTKQFAVDAEEALDLCTTMGRGLKEWLKNSRGPSIIQRALCIVDIGIFCGWDVIDEDPLVLDEFQLHQRWYSQFNDEGPVTTPGCFKPEIIVPEMLLALFTIDQNIYWDLLRGRFPIVPSEARQNRNHPWWQQHGSGVVNKLVEVLKSTSPAGFVFEVRQDAFGFWRKDA